MVGVTGVSEATVRRIWYKHGLKPHLARTLKVSKDPQFDERPEGVVGFHLNPPEHALVLCVGEKSAMARQRCSRRLNTLGWHGHQYVRRPPSASGTVTVPAPDR